LEKRRRKTAKEKKKWLWGGNGWEVTVRNQRDWKYEEPKKRKLETKGG